MRIEHRGQPPKVHETAYVAPTAVLSGNVTVGPDARILHHAVLTAEDGSIHIGARCVVMEHALIRARAAHPVTLGDDVLIGPQAHVNGARIGAETFIATGAAIFPGVTIGARAEIRIHGVVHVNSALAEDAVVPIGWIAVGDPATILPPDRHDEIWAIQEPLDFPGTVYGEPRGPDLMRRVMPKQAAWFGAHRDDRIL
jgi:carbonic anhydrase/acetyltransferase-like protein (isoleucine patch superfamily)